MHILDDLVARGLVHDTTDADALRARLDEGPLPLYCGFDPTADSLHIGSLIGLLVLRRFQDAGHRPIALAGGATGMVGDPSGKSEERNLLDDAELAANVAGIKAQIQRIVPDARLVDNADWTRELRLLDFLRDVGKHATVNQMVAKESVKARMDSEHGISYTEFTYMLLQAFDFLTMHEDAALRCEMQVGGSDQWGNITLGIDLIRRRTGATVHGLTWPLLLRSDGRKFGKSEAGNVWLSAGRTSPYAFYQYWMQVPDADVRRFLLQLTLLSVDEANAVADEHERAPEQRVGQRRLALEITTLVHGADAAAAAGEASALLFGGSSAATSAEALALLADEIPTTPVPRHRVADGVDVADLFAEAGVESSLTKARKAVAEGGAYVNNERVPEGRVVGEADLLHDRWILLRRGKRTYHLVEVGEAAVH